jgi:hypothetical protein
MLRIRLRLGPCASLQDVDPDGSRHGLTEFRATQTRWNSPCDRRAETFAKTIAEAALTRQVPDGSSQIASSGRFFDASE